MKPGTRQILERYDEQGCYEFHSDFRYPETEEKANRVARRLEALGIRLTFEGAIYNQDASFSVALLLHSYEQRKDDMLYLPSVRFSNFGNLVSIMWSQQIPEIDLKHIVDELGNLGLTFVPEAELDCTYDGVMSDNDTFRSWWIRYFDWI